MKALTRFIYRFFRRSRAAYSEVSGGILPKFELIQAFMVVIVTCKNEEDPIKNEGSRVLTRFSPRGQLTPNPLVWPKFELVRDIIVVLVTCKYEEDTIKNDFPHYNPMGAIRCHGNQSSDPIWPKT